jgi:hypothetical protein
MRLPAGDKAIIERHKIVDYCLSFQHDEGKHKARLFRDLLGITIDQADMLVDALRNAAASGDAVPGDRDRYGQRYTIDFEMVGPRGRVTARSAWVIRTGETIPRLVTCYIL